MATRAKPAPMGRRLRELREAAGLQLDDAAYQVRQMLPDAMGVSRETIRRYETGDTSEEKANLLVLVALAGVYGCKVSDFAPKKGEELGVVKDLLMQTPVCLTADDVSLVAQHLLTTSAA